MDELLFSVVIPSHNRPDFLKRTVVGLENQLFQKSKFEVIIILSPNDSSYAWLNSYKTDLNLKFLTPSEDRWNGKNVSFKRNHGAKLGQGRWVAFTDDDCIPHEGWLLNAEAYQSESDVYGVEGSTVTPEGSPKTLTWKGMQQLAKQGGFQTCNIFYRSEVFSELTQGFDSVHFPWFLEDTDLAWSVLDLGKKIAYEPRCVVTHPVGPRASWRLLHEAKGAGLKLRLFLKHPKQYEADQMKAMRWSNYVYLMLVVMAAVFLVLGAWVMSAASVVLLLFVLTLHMTKLFWGLEFTVVEIFEVAWRTVVASPLALWSLLIERQRTGLPFTPFIKLIKP